MIRNVEDIREQVADTHFGAHVRDAMLHYKIMCETVRDRMTADRSFSRALSKAHTPEHDMAKSLLKKLDETTATLCRRERLSSGLTKFSYWPWDNETSVLGMMK